PAVLPYPVHKQLIPLLLFFCHFPLLQLRICFLFFREFEPNPRGGKGGRTILRRAGSDLVSHWRGALLDLRRRNLHPRSDRLIPAVSSVVPLAASCSKDSMR